MVKTKSIREHPLYSASELYKLYMMSKEAKYRLLVPFFFRRSKEGPAREALASLIISQNRWMSHLQGITKHEIPVKNKKTVLVNDILVMMYNIPLQNVPLYVNHEIKLIRVVAKWRLQLNK